MTLDLRVEADAWVVIDNPEALATLAFRAVADLTECSGDVSVLLTDDAAMQALNTEWRGKAESTDVLSFPAGDMEPGFLGDIAVGFGVASDDAKEQSKTLTHHLSHLLIHGFLHLCGYDHIADTDAAKMMAIETEALASLGITDPYLPK